MQATDQPDHVINPPFPLIQLLQQALVVHGKDGSASGPLRVAATLHLAASGRTGPMGPMSSSAQRLAMALDMEELGWRQWCEEHGGGDANTQIRALLDGVAGFLVIPLLAQGVATLVVRLDTFTLARSAAAAAATQPQPSMEQLTQAAAHSLASAAAAASSGQPLANTSGLHMLQFAAGGTPPQVLAVQAATAAPAGPVLLDRQTVSSNGSYPSLASPPEPHRPPPSILHPTAASSMLPATGPPAHMQIGAEPTAIVRTGHVANSGKAMPLQIPSWSKVKSWGWKVFPGQSDLAVTARAMVHTLYYAHDEALGPLTLTATGVGSGISKYRQGDVRVKDVVATHPTVFIMRQADKSLPNVHTVRLNLKELEKAAHAAQHGDWDSEEEADPHQGAPQPQQQSGPSSSSSADTQVAMRVPAVLQHELHALTEHVYPLDAQYRAAKIATVTVLLCAKNHTLHGPQFGSVMGKEHGALWHDLPKSRRMLSLTSGDRYLVLDNAQPPSIRLDMITLTDDLRRKGLSLAPITQSSNGQLPSGYVSQEQTPSPTAAHSPHSSLSPQSDHQAPPEPLPTDPEALRAMAEQAYAHSEPYRAVKVHAVWVLAKHLQSLGPEDSAVMPGPSFGGPMKEALPYAWGEVPAPKIKSLCARDRFLHCEEVKPNVGIRLDVEALCAAARTGSPHK